MYFRDCSTTFFDGLHLTARTRTKLEFGFCARLADSDHQKTSVMR